MSARSHTGHRARGSLDSSGRGPRYSSRVRTPKIVWDGRSHPVGKGGSDANARAGRARPVRRAPGRGLRLVRADDRAPEGHSGSGLEPGDRLARAPARESDRARDRDLAACGAIARGRARRSARRHARRAAALGRHRAYGPSGCSTAWRPAWPTTGRRRRAGAVPFWAAPARKSCARARPARREDGCAFGVEPRLPSHTSPTRIEILHELDRTLLTSKSVLP